MRHRVAGIIIKDGDVLLVRRARNGNQYYVFPGGGVEDGENLEEALKREIKEETSLVVSNPRLIFELDNPFLESTGGRPNEHYFLVEDFSGKVELGEPEKSRVNEKNQYSPGWVKLDPTNKFDDSINLLPAEAARKLSEFLTAIKKL